MKAPPFLKILALAAGAAVIAGCAHEAVDPVAGPAPVATHDTPAATNLMGSRSREYNPMANGFERQPPFGSRYNSSDF